MNGLGGGIPGRGARKKRRLSSMKKAFLDWEVGGGVGLVAVPIPAYWG